MRVQSMKRRLGFPTKPPAGFLSLPSTANNPGDRQKNKSSASNEQHAPEEAEKRRMMNSVLNVMLTDGRNSKSVSPQPESTFRVSWGSRRSSWIKAPQPLPGWTVEEQQAFVDILNEHPKAGRDSIQFELALVKASKRIPTKTVADFHHCVKHIDASRVALFRST